MNDFATDLNTCSTGCNAGDIAIINVIYDLVHTAFARSWFHESVYCVV